MENAKKEMEVVVDVSDGVIEVKTLLKRIHINGWKNKGVTKDRQGVYTVIFTR